ncbi:peptidylprolyl isomerase [Xanthovirga aplysinae]|uniref:peptidylprolyl isomerase n=1 Tax=Xanthovirga aplysinae TaxID=2529853 RepID=UPI001FE7134B|nr:peptidylprolyl isomerase [Xanthovirga aplysinae]
MIKTGISAVFALLFCVVSGFAQNNNGEVVDKIVAKVDNNIILKSEVENTYNDYLARSNYRTTIDKCQILESLVIQKVLVAKAEIDSVTVADEQVQANLDRRMQYFISQVGSADKIEEYYGKTIKQFKDELQEQVKEQMVAQQMQDNITADIKVTPAEVRSFFKSIPRDSLPLFDTEVEVAQIVKLPEISKEEKNKTRDLLNNLRSRIVAGEDFGKLARQYSQDPGSAQFGGEIGFFQRGQLAPEYEATALRLKPGEIASPVESEFGFHLIQLIERRGNEFNTRHILIKPTPTDADLKVAEHYLDSLRQDILDEKITFEKAAKEYSEDKATAATGGFFSDESDNNLKISTKALDFNIFLTVDTMKVGSITKPLEFTTKDGKKAARILFYKDRIKAHQANLKQDYQKIYMATLNEKKTDAINEWFKTAKNDVFIQIDEEYDKCKILED